ncbi:hypothetical protein LGK97_02825 [Clostridium sp. CS001]|uniref:hypothetical protein n=1 Tax=Clostridium sp. CS001 TaxID=2880648 RepID=UPI001CF1B2BE|nr:hypothetical protein [Clostridium sp. CS001]MCB2288697.1 hypothetical protein [Clostridium sp. CS001]
MKILQKKLLVFLFTLSITLTGMTGMVFAHINYGTPTAIVNDTKDTAYQLKANTIQDSLSYLAIPLSGTLSDSNDADWYKVFLYSGNQTLTLKSYDNDKIAEVISEDGTLVSKSIHGPSTKRQERFTITTSGTYYIKVYSNESFSTTSSYSILIGAPEYRLASYTKSLNTNMVVTPTKKVSSNVSFDLSTDTSIPATAIVREINIMGTETNKYYVDDKIRSIKPISQYSWFDLTGPAIFTKNVLNPSQPIMLKQNWSFKHSVSGFFAPYTSYSLNPIIEFNYYCEENY